MVVGVVCLKGFRIDEPAGMNGENPPSCADRIGLEMSSDFLLSISDVEIGLEMSFNISLSISDGNLLIVFNFLMFGFAGIF